jgi:hypothetical protein
MLVTWLTSRFHRLLRGNAAASHRIDPTEEYNKNLEQSKKKSGPPKKKSGSVGRPTNPDLLFTKMTKKRSCTQSGFAKKRTPEQKSC